MGFGTFAALAMLQLAPAVPALQEHDVRAVEVADDGTVWLGVRDHGLARLAGDGADGVEWVDGLPLDGVADLHQDTHGRMWAAGLGGVAVLSNGTWSHVPDPGTLGARVVFRISEEDGEDGGLWFATTAGAARLLDGRWETVTSADGLPHPVVHAVLPTEGSTLWFACRRGLARLDEDGVRIFEPDTNFRAILEDPHGTLWFGTSSGFRRWDGDRLTRVSQGGAVYPALVDRNGTLWSGSAGRGVLMSSGADWSPLPIPSELSGAEIFDLAEDEGGRIWVATSRGVWTISPRPPTAPSPRPR